MFTGRDQRYCPRKIPEGMNQVLIGSSLHIKKIKHIIEKVAPTDVPVLITGASGTGKDVVATELHRHSSRASVHLTSKNCAGLNKNLARAEIFGFEKGAYTDASCSREGLVSQADQGTLFLDEIGDLPLDTQAQFLHFLETSKYRTVGGTRVHKADVRLIFATNKDLPDMVAEGIFNEALYHRINVVQIELLPLKERLDDIPVLINYFLSSFGKGSFKVSPGVLNIFLNYSWPGNVRELRNILERATIMSDNSIIGLNDIPDELKKGLEFGCAKSSHMLLSSSGVPGDGLSFACLAEEGMQNVKCAEFSHCHSGSLNLDCAEREHIQKVYLLYGKNKTKTAKALGIDRRSLYRKLKRFNLD